MSAPCPFCGDERAPLIHEENPGDGGKNLHMACCMCCGAQGPVSKTVDGAITLWNNRENPGASRAWRLQYEKIT